jgi:NhaA family Na+:H+ antiporter
VQTTVNLARGSVSVVEWLEHVLHPWTSYVIVPLFALANAGVLISPDRLVDGLTGGVGLGVLAGLSVGKLVGISAATWLFVRFGPGRLPANCSWRHVIGAAALGGVGFTVSLFISDLAFTDPDQAAQARLAVLAASVLSAALGSAVLVGAGNPGPDPDAAPEVRPAPDRGSTVGPHR